MLITTFYHGRVLYLLKGRVNVSPSMSTDFWLVYCAGLAHHSVDQRRLRFLKHCLLMDKPPSDLRLVNIVLEAHNVLAFCKVHTLFLFNGRPVILTKLLIP